VDFYWIELACVHYWQCSSSHGNLTTNRLSLPFRTISIISIRFLNRIDHIFLDFKYFVVMTEVFLIVFSDRLPSNLSTDSIPWASKPVFKEMRSLKGGIREVAIPWQSSQTLAFQCVVTIARGELGDRCGKILPEGSYRLMVELTSPLVALGTYQDKVWGSDEDVPVRVVIEDPLFPV